MGVSWYQSARLFRGNRLTVGADYYRFGGEAWNRYVGGDRKGERSDIADKSQDEVAVFVVFWLKSSEFWKIPLPEAKGMLAFWGKSCEIRKILQPEAVGKQVGWGKSWKIGEIPKIKK